jgi:uncharacterized membrane protein YuzA (DUF378 family)
MEWYWYVLIGLAVVGIGYLKISLFQKMKEKKQPKHHDEDD